MSASGMRQKLNKQKEKNTFDKREDAHTHPFCPYVHFFCPHARLLPLFAYMSRFSLFLYRILLLASLPSNPHLPPQPPSPIPTPPPLPPQPYPPAPHPPHQGSEERMCPAPLAADLQPLPPNRWLLLLLIMRGWTHFFFLSIFFPLILPALAVRELVRAPPPALGVILRRGLMLLLLLLVWPFVFPYLIVRWFWVELAEEEELSAGVPDPMPRSNSSCELRCPSPDRCPSPEEKLTQRKTL